MTLDSQLDAIRDGGGDPKRARILEGALKVFLAYGYNRTTMDDIARAAELSRPALYLLFRNKTDIYRAIGGCLLVKCLAGAKAVLGGDGPLLDRLDSLCEDVFHAMMHEIEVSPHGPELLDMRNSLAGDIIGRWRDELVEVLEQAIAAEAAANGTDLAARGLSARAIAETYFDAMEGMKVRLSDPQRHLETARSVSRLVVAAIRR